MRTRAALRQALMELIGEKGYEALTVDEITKRADLGGPLFTCITKTKMICCWKNSACWPRSGCAFCRSPVFGLDSRIRKRMQIDGANKPIQPFLMVFQHVADNAELYRILLKSRSLQPDFGPNPRDFD
jgi:hypothetical protein